jgi:hypothetical protein
MLLLDAARAPTLLLDAAHAPTLLLDAVLPRSCSTPALPTVRRMMKRRRWRLAWKKEIGGGGGEWKKEIGGAG